MSADFLQAMARSSRERVAHARAICSQSTLRERALAASPAPPLQLSALLPSLTTAPELSVTAVA